MSSVGSVDVRCARGRATEFAARGGRSPRSAVGSLRPVEPLRCVEAARAARPQPRAGRGVGSPAVGLRLTRRGRLVLRGGAIVLLLAAVLGTVLLLSRPAVAGSERHAIPVHYHVVLPGETLWSIAGQEAPGVDRRDTIAEIVELNALPGSGVQVGQRIALPGPA